MASSLGTDLLVVPAMAAHDAAGLDLVVRSRFVVRRVGAAGETRDLQTVSERENLAQALILRLLTPRGSLAALGHAAYGSQLHTLIGQRKTEALRNLCRAFVLEVVADEPRVEDKAVDLSFDLPAERFDTFVFTLSVKPKASDQPVGLALEFGL